ncbi:WcaJ Sugar transferases involved in lipopolysaccharide synthesis [Burkholderiaceae bacterium]
MSIRACDIILAAIGLFFLSPVFVILFIAASLDTRSPFYFQWRVGRDQRPFVIVKFRTMKVGTQTAATHLVNVDAITPVGRLLRRTKLDELPQLWNVLKGDMSLVGPRPCLPSQAELIAERSVRNVYSVRPGITGLAQIQGVDMSSPKLLAEIDSEMLQDFNLATYYGIIFKTLAHSLVSNHSSGK